MLQSRINDQRAKLSKKAFHRRKSQNSLRFENKNHDFKARKQVQEKITSKCGLFLCMNSNNVKYKKVFFSS